MSILMDRIRLVILTGDDVRAALKLAAARKRLDMSEVADTILRAALVKELAEVQSEDDKGEQKTKKK